MKQILITGNMGYVGPVLAAHLRARFPHARLAGFDNAYFAHCLTGAQALPERRLDVQHFGDIRRFPHALLAGCDAVVHLAAISNDPMGTRFAAVTEEINHRAAVALARAALAAGVQRFVFASSCSVYGFAPGSARREQDALDPLTAYSRSKVAAEAALQTLGGDMVVTALRFGTACGVSPRMRLDLVVNDFVASALACGEINVLSDGTPWRPLIDVRDMARAMEWALVRPETGARYLAVNAGCDAWNYQVSALADAVAAAIPGTKVSVNREAPPDRRSYQVDFSLFRSLAPEHQPICRIEDSVRSIAEALRAAGFSDPAFRSSQYIRLRVLDRHIAEGRLDDGLNWRS